MGVFFSKYKVCNFYKSFITVYLDLYVSVSVSFFPFFPDTRHQPISINKKAEDSLFGVKMCILLIADSLQQATASPKPNDGFCER